MGVRHAVVAAGRRAVPPRVDPLRARRPTGRQLPGPPVTDPRPLRGSREVAAAHDALLLARRRRGPRVVGPPVDHRLARRRRRLPDVRRRARRGRPPPSGDVATWSATTCSPRSRPSSRRAGRRDHWVGYFGYASRPDLPAATGSRIPDAVWMRARHVRMSTTHATWCEPSGGRRARRPATASPPRKPAAGRAPGGRTPTRSPTCRSSCTRATPTRSTSPTGEPAQRPRPGHGVPPAARAQPRAVRRLPPARPPVRAGC